MLNRLAAVCYRRRRRVLVLWVLGIVVLGAVMGAVGTGYRSDFTLPDVESKRGIDLLDEQFGGQGNLAPIGGPRHALRHTKIAP